VNSLTPLQRRLCNILQDGLPVCSKPFAEIAKLLDSSQENVLKEIRKLKKAGVIRRLGAVINYRSLGKVSTLVTSHVPEEDVQEVAAAVNEFSGVSHNYLRKHYYNLWFTLQGNSQAEIDAALRELSAQFGIDFHSLPVEQSFKLDVRFDAANGEGVAVNGGSTSLTTSGTKSQIPKAKKIELDEKQKQILSGLQNELQIVEQPFDFLCDGKLKEQDVLKIINSLMGKGVISRIGAIVDHYKLGFAANVMFVCSVPEERIIEAGKTLANFSMVSHCYQRKTFEGWPYNLFAMMHALSMSDIQRTIDEFTAAEKIVEFELLPTVAELKKQSVKHLL
jgi:DNA-binding Lrp family transcriptional regulator